MDYTTYWLSASKHFAHNRYVINTSPEELFIFFGKPFVEPFSNFFEIAEVLLSKRVSNWCKEVISDCSRSEDYSGGGRMSHPSNFKVSFDVWDGSLSCNKITLPCLLAHSGRFLISVWFKLMICWRYRCALTV